MKNLENTELNDTRTRFTMRLPESIHERVKEIAKQSKLSVNNQYTHIVKNYLESFDREEYENSEEYWNELYASVPKEYRPTEEIGKSLNTDELHYMKSEIRKAIKRLRDAVNEIEKRLALFEGRYFSAKLYYNSDKKKYLDITLKEINDYSRQIEKEKNLLDQAKYLLNFFLKINPADQHPYQPTPDTGIPEYTKLINVTNRINSFIKENFEETVNMLIEANRLVKIIDNSYGD